MNKAEQIEKYLAGELTEQESAQLLQEAEADPELKQEIELRKTVNEHLDNRERRVFMDTLKKTGSEYHAEQRSRQKMMWRIAASLLILLAVGVALIYTLGTTSKENVADLYNKYYQRPEAISVNRSNSTAADQHLSDGMEQYSIQRFSQAEKTFLSILKTDSLNQTALFYTAISMMEQGNTNGALTYFQKLEKLPSGIYSAQTFWYEGLCLLKSRDNKDARKCFEKAGEYSRYKEDASKILKELGE
jgi:tetratricopeptide (TPR) repeat protein